MEDLADWWEQLQADDVEEEPEPEGSDPSNVLAAAARYKSGRAMAQQVSGNGGLQRASGSLLLDWHGAVAALEATTSASERVAYVEAFALFGQSPVHAEEMRVAGVMGALARVIHWETPATIPAVNAIRHLACANHGNREEARAGRAGSGLLREEAATE